MVRYPPSLEPPALLLSQPLSSDSSRSSSSRSSSCSTKTTAAGAICSSNGSTHLPSATSLAAASRVHTGVYIRRNGPCYLAWYAVSAGNIRNITIKEQYKNISNGQRSLCFRSEGNCEHMRNVWFASSGIVIAALNRVRLVNARRGPDLVNFEWSGLPIFVAT